MRLLDLFGGEGGATAGYQAAGFHVTAVDLDRARLRHNPADEVVLADAIAYVTEHGHKFDAIHASPPCQGYSIATSALTDRADRYDRLIPATRAALVATGKPYVIENVYGARGELIDPILLCGSMFDLTAVDDDGTLLRMERHRVFETNFDLAPPRPCFHDKSVDVGGSYGGARRDRWEAKHVRRGGYVPSLPVQRALLGAPWMTQQGCYRSIPPVYAEYIGRTIKENLA